MHRQLADILQLIVLILGAAQKDTFVCLSTMFSLMLIHVLSRFTGMVSR